jgi:hypothetical protein
MPLIYGLGEVTEFDFDFAFAFIAPENRGVVRQRCVFLASLTEDPTPLAEFVSPPRIEE